MKKLSIVLTAAFLVACTGVPDGVEVVDDFELEPYLGTWYEIARLDHSFERGLSNVTATYTPRDGGGINVLNRGYREAESEWDEADGKAFFVEEPNIGRLKVSFFGPFYGGYNVVAVDPGLYSLVVGPNRSYLWILARETELPEDILDELLATAAATGFDTDALIYVTHDRPQPEAAPGD